MKSCTPMLMSASSATTPSRRLSDQNGSFPRHSPQKAQQHQQPPATTNHGSNSSNQQQQQPRAQGKKKSKLRTALKSLKCSSRAVDDYGELVQQSTIDTATDKQFCDQQQEEVDRLFSSMSKHHSHAEDDDDEETMATQQDATLATVDSTINGNNDTSLTYYSFDPQFQPSYEEDEDQDDATGINRGSSDDGTSHHHIDNRIGTFLIDHDHSMAVLSADDTILKSSSSVVTREELTDPQFQSVGAQEDGHLLLHQPRQAQAQSQSRAQSAPFVSSLQPILQDHDAEFDLVIPSHGTPFSGASLDRHCDLGVTRTRTRTSTSQHDDNQQQQQQQLQPRELNLKDISVQQHATPLRSNKHSQFNDNFASPRSTVSPASALALHTHNETAVITPSRCGNQEQQQQQQQSHLASPIHLQRSSSQLSRQTRLSLEPDDASITIGQQERKANRPSQVLVGSSSWSTISSFTVETVNKRQEFSNKHQQQNHLQHRRHQEHHSMPSIPQRSAHGSHSHSHSHENTRLHDNCATVSTEVTSRSVSTISTTAATTRGFFWRSRPANKLEQCQCKQCLQARVVANRIGRPMPHSAACRFKTVAT